MLRRRMMMIAQPEVVLPEGYTKLKYLESDGRSWVETGITLAAHNKVVAKFAVTDTTASRNYIWGAVVQGVARSQFSYSNPAFLGYGTVYQSSVSINVDTNIHKVVMESGKFKIDGNTIWDAGVDWTGSEDVTISLFGSKNESNQVRSLSKGVKLYSWQAFKDADLVMDLTPCKNPEGVVGFLDMISGIFYELMRANGAYIQDTEGTLWRSSAWDGTKTANGVAVIDDECSFVIACESAIQTWMPDLTGNVDIPEYSDVEAAKADYSGRLNTERLLPLCFTEEDAPLFCANYTFPNGKKGYLGSAGEWDVVARHYSDIEKCFSKIGEGGISPIYSNFWWTSSRAPASFYIGNDSTLYWVSAYGDEIADSPEAWTTDNDCLPFTEVGQIAGVAGEGGKKENKISIQPSLRAYVAVSTFPVASDVVVSGKVSYGTIKFTIKAGNSVSAGSTTSNVSYIISVSPTEDDTYFYTF